jgi:hypothetical protein
MTREEKCKYAFEKGYSYDPLTGKVFGIHGKEITRKHKGYTAINLRINGVLYNLFGHQYAWYLVNKECVDEIDHINGNPSDNRWTNLRSVTRNENQWNRKNAKGYYFNKAMGKWKSTIYINWKGKHLGYFNTEQEAREAYLKAKEQYHII